MNGSSKRQMAWAAAGIWLLAAAPASAISHDEIMKGAVDGATSAAEKEVEAAKDSAVDQVKEKAAESGGGALEQVESAKKAVDSGQKTLKAGQDTLDAVKGLSGD